MRIFSFLKKKSSSDKLLIEQLRDKIGVLPSNLSLYKTALTHKSISEEEHNERLEFLGDAILNSIVSEYLYKNFKNKDEGNLTKIRSRVVSRVNLNAVALKMGIESLIEFRKSLVLENSSLPGNALEAIIGAIYLYKGLKKAETFIVDKLINQYSEIDTIINTQINFKSQLLEWCQKEKRILSYLVSKKKTDGYQPFYEAVVIIDGIQYESGQGTSKKKAEQQAAKVSFEQLLMKN